MKGYEAAETARKLDPTLPIYARIDGRSFSRFTRGMHRPFDAAFTGAMIETTKHLLHATHARIGYCQSDEISLVWLAEPESDVIFSGKVQKMVSILASLAAAKFNQVIPQKWRGRLPHFDCRVFQLPSKDEAANVVLWRAMDARKNAISMVAQDNFSHKQLHGKDQKAMLKMLSDAGVSMDDFPVCFRLGTFLQRETVERELTAADLSKIPEVHRPTGPVTRTDIRIIDMPPFNEVKNRVAVIFENAAPER